MKAILTEKQEAIARLKSWLKPGDTVYTIVRHVSRSGMMREISAIKLEMNKTRKEIQPIYLSYNIAKALGWTMAKGNDAVKVGGCGMDMGFHLVYTLSKVLFADKLKTDAGYALKQAWL